MNFQKIKKTCTLHWPLLLVQLILLYFFREFFFTGKLIYGQDIIGLNYPVEKFITDSFKAGELPLWNPYSAAGYPFLPGSSVFYPLNLLFRFLPFDMSFSLSTILHLMIAAVAMYSLTTYLGISRFGRFLATLSFCLSGFFLIRIHSGHYMLIQSLSWFPLFFLYFDKLLNKCPFRNILPPSIFAALIILP